MTPRLRVFLAAGLPLVALDVVTKELAMDAGAAPTPREGRDGGRSVRVVIFGATRLAAA